MIHFHKEVVCIAESLFARSAPTLSIPAGRGALLPLISGCRFLYPDLALFPLGDAPTLARNPGKEHTLHLSIRM
jgi:hypothetical protein